MDEELHKIVRSHRLWLRDEEGGKRANLTGADLAGADLRGADLRFADLAGANLAGADLSQATLAHADLTRATLERAHLTGASLAHANLAGATMPDGRTWEVYRADHLAGICSEPEVVARAVAAWGTHHWSGCPMHAALGIDDLTDIDNAERRRLVACWVALYDAGLLDVSGAR